MSWKDIVKFTKESPAKYKYGTNIEEFERMAWERGTPVTNGKTWKVFTSNDIVGATNGIETRHAVVKMSANTIHGHPITPAEFKDYTK